MASFIRPIVSDPPIEDGECTKCQRTTYWCHCHIVWVRNPDYITPKS
jgi:hypothetical protein